MRNDDTGKAILVTGASSGIGALSVRALALAGHTVYAGIRQMAIRNATAVADLVRYGTDHRVDVHAVELDVTSQDSADGAIDRIVTEHSRLDMVVHNAGHMVLGAAEAFTAEQFADLYDVNVLGTQRVNRAALPKLREQGSGLLVWIGSTSTRGGCPLSWPRTSPPRPRWTPWPSATPPRCFRSASTPRSWCLVRSPPAPTTSPTRAPPPTSTVRKPTTSVTNPLWTTWASTWPRSLIPSDADAAEVAEAVARLVAMKHGTRPLRTHIDPSRDGSEVVSAVADRLRADFFRRIGLDSLLTAGSSL